MKSQNPDTADCQLGISFKITVYLKRKEDCSRHKTHPCLIVPITVNGVNDTGKSICDHYLHKEPISHGKQSLTHLLHIKTGRLVYLTQKIFRMLNRPCHQLWKKATKCA